MGDTEKVAKTLTVHGKGCIGCQRHKKAAMISFQIEGEGDEIIDLFLDEEQVKYLIKRVKTEFESPLKTPVV